MSNKRLFAEWEDRKRLRLVDCSPSLDYNKCEEAQ